MYISRGPMVCLWSVIVAIPGYAHSLILVAKNNIKIIPEVWSIFYNFKQIWNACANPDGVVGQRVRIP